MLLLGSFFDGERPGGSLVALCICLAGITLKDPSSSGQLTLRHGNLILTVLLHCRIVRAIGKSFPLLLWRYIFLGGSALSGPLLMVHSSFSSSYVLRAENENGINVLFTLFGFQSNFLFNFIRQKIRGAYKVTTTRMPLIIIMVLLAGGLCD